jgi:hypothetical protein
MRHSDLTNPNDLHFAKIRTFAGTPASITPDFIDQLLASSETNKIYRATSTSLGGLIELVPVTNNGNGGGNENGASLLLVGSGRPTQPPSAIGEPYFDSDSGVLWCSVNVLGSPTWRSSVPPIKISSLQFSDADFISYFSSVSAGEFVVFHGTGYQPDSSKAIEFNTLNEIGSLADIESLIDQYGAGIYGIGYHPNDPNAEVSNYSIYVSPYFLEGSSDGSTDKVLWVVCRATHNAMQASGFFYVAENRRLGGSLEISVYIGNLS